MSLFFIYVGKVLFGKSHLRATVDFGTPFATSCKALYFLLNGLVWHLRLRVRYQRHIIIPIIRKVKCFSQYPENLISPWLKCENRIFNSDKYNTSAHFLNSIS